MTLPAADAGATAGKAPTTKAQKGKTKATGAAMTARIKAMIEGLAA